MITKGTRITVFPVYTASVMFFLIADLSHANYQSVIDYIANNLDLRFSVISNDQMNCRLGLTFTNKGQEEISSGRWFIYFGLLRVFNQNFDESASLSVKHINGYLHQLQPTNMFKTLKTGKSAKYFLSAQSAMVAKTDVMPNWYVAADGLEPRIIRSTSGEELKFVGSFDTSSQWKRSVMDTYNPLTPAKRYQINDIADRKAIRNVIIPTPLEINYLSSSQTVNFSQGSWRVLAPEILTPEAHYLAEMFNMKVSEVQKPRKVITLGLGAVYLQGNETQDEEAYNVLVDPTEQIIRIVGKSRSGVFWGIQSLRSLETNGVVPWVKVEDAPRYHYRGLSVDVARNFLPKDDVMKILDGMAMYKMNKLHLHLTDDEGWRLEISGLPELTQIASKRCHNPRENVCLTPQLGSGPFSNTSGSGHYSVKDYIQILKYASDRHIEVIPEFDLPGHSHAAITAMSARREKFRGKGRFQEGLKFSLSDLKDKSFYQSGQFFRNNAVNPCLESTYDFVDKLVRAVRNLHSGTQPLNVIHLGGDEVPSGAWHLSPVCHNLAKKLNRYPNWKVFFTQRVAAITGKYGINLALWEDGLVHSSTQSPIDRRKLSTDLVYGFAWGSKLSHGYNLANAGYKVVMAQASHLYFDHPYEPDPNERGTYWATRYTDTRKVFGFMPDHLYDSQETDTNGQPIVDYCRTVDVCVKLMMPQNILGLTAAIWSETIRTPDQFQSMIFPRLLAAAEKAWHQDSWENIRNKKARDKMKTKSWQTFANTVGHKELARLDKLGIAYRVPLPGARDGGCPWAFSGGTAMDGISDDLVSVHQLFIMSLQMESGPAE